MSVNTGFPARYWPTMWFRRFDLKKVPWPASWVITASANWRPGSKSSAARIVSGLVQVSTSQKTAKMPAQLRARVRHASQFSLLVK